MVNNRRYYLTWQGETWEVFPYDADKLKFTNNKEQGYIFKRKKLSGNLVFKGADFTKLFHIDLSTLRCSEITIEIYRDCNDFQQAEWRGYFSMQMCKFDLDNCQVTVTAEPDDEYRCIFDILEKEYDMFQSVCGLVTTVETLGTIETCRVTEEFLCDPDPIPCSGYADVDEMLADGWGVFYHNPVPYNDAGAHCEDCPGQLCYLVTTIWQRQVITIPCGVGDVCDPADAPDDSWVLIGTSCGTFGCMYASPKTGALKYRGKRYDCLLETVITDACSDITELTSIFLDKNPDTDSPFYNSGLNYSYLSNNVDYNNLMITQASDALRPKASGGASKGIFTLKKLLDWAKVVMNCYWDLVYDSTTNSYKFRLEHLSFYENNDYDLDLTASEYVHEVKSMNKYEHIRDELPAKEIFKYGQAWSDWFKETSIIYSKTCASEKVTETNETADLTADLDWAIKFPDIFSDTGFFMLALGKIGSDYYVINKIPYGKTDSVINGVLSWPTLFQFFHRHGRVLNEDIEGNVFLSFRPNARQSGLQICFKCKTLDTYKKVRTELGDRYFGGINGEIEAASYSFGDDELSLTLLYQFEPYRCVEYLYLTNGNFIVEVTEATGTVNAWNILETATFGGDMSWAPSRIEIISNNAFSFQYLFYQVYDGVSLSDYIDSTKVIDFECDIVALNVRNGKKIILTFNSVDAVGGNEKYYQVDLTDTPYGHVAFSINPSDWIPGSPVTGLIGAGIAGSQLVTFFVTTGNAGTNRDDDYYIDNVKLSKMDCGVN